MTVGMVGSWQQADQRLQVSRSGQPRAADYPSAQSRIERLRPPLLDLLHRGVPSGQPLARDDGAKGAGEVVAPPGVASRSRARPAIGSRHDASPTIDSAARNSTGSGVGRGLERLAQIVEREPAAAAGRAPRVRPRAPSSIRPAAAAGSAASRSRIAFDDAEQQRQRDRVARRRRARGAARSHAPGSSGSPCSAARVTVAAGSAGARLVAVVRSRLPRGSLALGSSASDGEQRARWWPASSVAQRPQRREAKRLRAAAIERDGGQPIDSGGAPARRAGTRERRRRRQRSRQAPRRRPPGSRRAASSARGSPIASSVRNAADARRPAAPLDRRRARPAGSTARDPITVRRAIGRVARRGAAGDRSLHAACRSAWRDEALMTTAVIDSRYAV